jgi:hypothetical protein
MLRTLARWSPSILLAVLFILGAASGAMMEPLAIAVLVGVQLLVVAAPKAAHKAGVWYGERRAADEAADA